MNYLIKNSHLLVDEGDRIAIRKENLYIRDGKISFVPFTREESYQPVDAGRHLVMPGLINMHTHAYMTLMRNYADDVEFSKWLFEGVMPVEDRLPKEAAYWSSLLAMSEMIRTGTTSFVDMHMYHRQSPLAAREAGMRAWIGRGLVGESLFEEGNHRFPEAMEEMEEFESDTLHFTLAPHAIYTCSPNLLKEVAEQSRERGLLKQIHLSESLTEVEDCIKEHGKTPVEYLADLGFLDKKTILAHCVQMRGDDLEILKESGASVVTNPASNAKLGNGFAPAAEMASRGINLCIGTDGTASNNTLNLFREMALLSLIQKGIRKDPVSMPAETVVRTATVNAAAALGMKDKLGVIREGAAADLIFLDLDAPSMFPNNNILSSLCYSAGGWEVDSVMINGKYVMKNRELLTIDMEKVLFEVQRMADQCL